MSISIVTKVVERFLTSANPGVLVIKGDWGTGKTYTFKNIVKQYNKSIIFEKYSYVSLFGVTSLSELRRTILLNSIPTKEINDEEQATYGLSGNTTITGEKKQSSLPQPSKYNSIETCFKTLIRQLERLPNVPYFQHNLPSIIELFANHFISDTIICFDDFERINPEQLSIDEFMGLISFLKEEKACKIIFIFNEDKLTNLEIYKKYREKVVDIEIVFEPNSEETWKAAFPEIDESTHINDIKKYVVILEIKNIRILRKISEFIIQLKKATKDFHRGVMERAIRFLVLYAECFYNPKDEIPTINFIKKWKGYVSQNDIKSPKSEKEIQWAEFLTSYGLEPLDKFELAVCNLVERGYIEETGFIEEAEKLHERLKAGDLRKAWLLAWECFHNSFEDNEEQLVDGFKTAFNECLDQLSGRDLDQIVLLFRELGRNQEADDFIERFINAAENDNPEIFNLAEYNVFGGIQDAEIQNRFKVKYQEKEDLPSLTEAIEKVSMEKGWPRAVVRRLSLATQDDFYNQLKKCNGANLRRVVISLLQFSRLGDPVFSAIGEKVSAALINIGKKHPLNRIRLERLGVTFPIDDENKADKEVSN